MTFAWILLALVFATYAILQLASKRKTRGVVPIAQLAEQFLGKKRIAITGVSRQGKSHGANIVYQRLRERGYTVFAVNPHAVTVEGDPAYPDLRSIPGGVEAVLIGTAPEHAMATMKECAELGVEYVWMHRSVDRGSVSNFATDWGHAHGIHVIDGGCPLMFGPVSDPGHRFMRGLLKLTGKVPRRVT